MPMDVSTKTSIWPSLHLDLYTCSEGLFCFGLLDLGFHSIVSTLDIIHGNNYAQTSCRWDL